MHVRRRDCLDKLETSSEEGKGVDIIEFRLRPQLIQLRNQPPCEERLVVAGQRGVGSAEPNRVGPRREFLQLSY